MLASETELSNDVVSGVSSMLKAPIAVSIDHVAWYVTHILHVRLKHPDRNDAFDKTCGGRS
jgi:hypothetical protein